MKVLFTGGLGDFIGAETFLNEQQKDDVTSVLWATRNREEIRSAIDMNLIFPNMKEEIVMFDNWANERPVRPWQPGDSFMNIGMKHELNTKCNLNLSKLELDEIFDCSLDATLQRMFNGLAFQSSRFATKGNWPSVDKFNLPQKYVVIHPWSDAEICGREFNEADWANITYYLEKNNLMGVVVNRSDKTPPIHNTLVDLTNKTTLKETFSIISKAYQAILCSSSLACFATKIFTKDNIWIKGGHEYIFTPWATHFYHGPFKSPIDVVFKNFDILNKSKINQSKMLDQGQVFLL